MCIGAEDAALAIAKLARLGVSREGMREIKGPDLERDIWEIVVIVTSEVDIVDVVGEGVEEETTLWAV